MAISGACKLFCRLFEHAHLFGLWWQPRLFQYALQPWQRVAREVIESLMCNYYVAWTDMAQRLNISAEEVKEALNYDVPALQQMADDGLITLEPTHIALTEAGSPFVRNVAAALDKMMINNNNRFSKPV